MVRSRRKAPDGTPRSPRSKPAADTRSHTAGPPVDTPADTPAEPPVDTPIEELSNLGPTSAAWLRAIGITTFGELCAHDPFEIWVAVRHQFPRASKNLYYALWGARHGRDWRSVPGAEKERFEQLRQGLEG